MLKDKLTKDELRPDDCNKKEQLEALLKKHGYRRDDRPDHREWTKMTMPFSFKIRLDQMNPDGWNGFHALITSYMRWEIQPEQLESLLKYLKDWNNHETS